MGFGSYQTARSWLHKIRKAIVRPGRELLAECIGVDETLAGGPRPGKRGRRWQSVAGAVSRAAATRPGKTARAAQAGRSGRHLDRSLAGFLAGAMAKPATISTDRACGYANLAAAGYDHESLNLSATWGEASVRLPAINVVFGLAVQARRSATAVWSNNSLSLMDS